MEVTDRDIFDTGGHYVPFLPLMKETNWSSEVLLEKAQDVQRPH
jgi:hypothetical protein